MVKDTTKRILLHQEHLKNGDYRNAGLELGVVLHYLEDTWTPSHAFRDETGRVKHFFNYAEQSPVLHAAEDNPASNSPTMLNAINAGSALIELASSVKDESDLERALGLRFYNISAYDPRFQDSCAIRASQEDVLSIGKKYYERGQAYIELYGHYLKELF